MQIDLFSFSSQNKKLYICNTENNRRMINRDNNLTNSFQEYLNYASSNNNLSDNTIIMSIYGALNEMDKDEDIVKLLRNMSRDYEHICMVLTVVARDFCKNQKYELINHGKDANDKVFTPQEIASIYSISEQAIRKACKEGRLPFEKGMGKNKYLIKKDDIEKYMHTAKGKSENKAA